MKKNVIKATTIIFLIAMIGLIACDKKEANTSTLETTTGVVSDNVTTDAETESATKLDAETESVTKLDAETESQTIGKSPSEMTVEEMKQYYDSTQNIGTPRIVTVSIGTITPEDEVIYVKWKISNSSWQAIQIDNRKGFESNSNYYAIAVDNNTPNKLQDDKVVHVFTIIAE